MRPTLLLLLAVAASLLPAPPAAPPSDHLDSPYIDAYPQRDIGDLFVWPGEQTGGPVFLINLNPLTPPVRDSMRGLDPAVLYEFKLDTDDDYVADLAYKIQVDGDGSRPDAPQTITLYKATAADADADAVAGERVAEGRSTGFGASTPEVIVGTGGGGLLPSPLREDRRTTLRAMLHAATLKANHRKVLVADAGDDNGYVTLVTSSNFENASSFFSNVAVTIRSTGVARHFLEAEKAVARMSGCEVPFSIPDEPSSDGGEALVTPLMGSQIKRAILRDLRAAGPGDRLYVFTFFLAERDVIRALVEADRRGARITLVLDPNRVSFGEEKHGLPNQSVASELAGLRQRDGSPVCRSEMDTPSGSPASSASAATKASTGGRSPSATSRRSTRTGSSPYGTARRTSSSPAGRTSPVSNSKTRSSNTPR